MKLRYLAPLLGAAAAAASIAMSPVASADPAPQALSCTNINAVGTECQTPGNVQINDSTPVQFTPQYDYTEGDFFHGSYNRGHR